ncbi:MAG: hypothetical protein BECKG1743D_GA0114223_1004110 [Candidatus Kentron sp. G]|nr:MAG: hypothetical protein BECKG1743F_GA0114225_100419 [Candidatus Kentron sp. G]VFM96127.1 MAG: hypothetical protein BECKG1743E_GA0114224_100379 [Candidatus Kentron sp. G]VFM98019.1 MAG: hypothetical protein BECKG1743D_GA0114223_1004110 [Candidatus Kentron sp. G]
MRLSNAIYVGSKNLGTQAKRGSEEPRVHHSLARPTSPKRAVRSYRQIIAYFYSSVNRGKCKSQIVSHNEAKTSEKAEFTWK